MRGNLRNLQSRVAAAFRELENAITDVSEVATGLQTGAGKQSRSVEEIASFISQVAGIRLLIILRFRYECARLSHLAV